MASLDRERYLSSTEIIDWDSPYVYSKAGSLAAGSGGDVAVTQACYLFVRDQVRHSIDHDMGPVTLSASEALRHQVGFCYAKSHLLAALLRANGIPAGLCYQRLKMSESAFCLHGLNAVFLKGHGWYRIDARGNNEQVHAEFCPPRECLAFPTSGPGEADLPEIHADPLPCVVRWASEHHDHREAVKHLPDVELVPSLTKSR